MKYLMILFAFLCSITAEGQERFNYSGVGIYKTYRNDTAIIKTDSAYLINHGILAIGLNALNYVQSNSSDSIIQVYEADKLASEKAYQEKSELLAICIQERKDLVGEHQVIVDTLKSNLHEKEKDFIVLEYENENQKTIIESQRKKIFWRNGLSGLLASVAAYLGIDKLLQ